MTAAVSVLPNVILPPGGVLVASPSTSVRERIIHSFGGGLRPVQEAVGGADALHQLETGNWQVLLLDRCLPDLDAEELIQIIRHRFPGIQAVLLDSDGGSSRFSADASGSAPPLSRAGDKFALGTNRTGQSTLGQRPPAAERMRMQMLPGMVGASDAMQRLCGLVRLVAPRNTTVLITGLTGTGKELVAKAIHQLSPRSARPFVVVNCAAIPEALLESELFGHARGAFTGAVQSHCGRIQAAQGGTLFLDEVGELPLGLQPKLLRFLEQKEVQRLGSSDTVRVDVRVLAATNSCLVQLIREKRFRQDLYYRLSTFPVEVPTLAERADDIVPLAQHFLASLSAAGNAPMPVLAAEAIRILEACPWDGNVRELQHVIERASILAEGSAVILPEHLCLLGGDQERYGLRRLTGTES